MNETLGRVSNSKPMTKIREIKGTVDTTSRVIQKWKKKSWIKVQNERPVSYEWLYWRYRCHSGKSNENRRNKKVVKGIDESNA